MDKVHALQVQPADAETAELKLAVHLVDTGLALDKAVHQEQLKLAETAELKLAEAIINGELAVDKEYACLNR